MTATVGPSGGGSLGSGGTDQEGTWLIAGGAFLALIALLLFISPQIGSVSVTALIGFGLLLGGIGMIVASVMGRAYGGMWPGVVIGSLLALAGFFLWTDLLKGTVALTSILIIWLIADGIVGGIVNIVQRAPGWGLGLVANALSILLGLFLWADFPSSAEWVLGVYAGIVVLLRGLSLIAAGMLLRREA